MSTHIPLHNHSLYDVYGVVSMTHILGRSIIHSNHVCEILSAHVPHRYWDIYENISYTSAHTR